MRRRRLGAWGFEGEAFPPSAQTLAAAAAALDPAGILNPHVLLDPTDRLEI